MSKGLDYFSDASEAWQAGDLKRARALFEKGSQNGDPNCQLNFGVFLESGLGGRKSLEEAIAWYRKAYRRSRSSAAAINLADACRKARRTALAAAWYRRAVALGDGDAAFEYAKFILNLKRRGYVKQVRTLLAQAIASKHITPGGRQSASKLLKSLQDIG